MNPGPTITFGDYRLDSVGGQLYRGNERVALAPKAFALLQCLSAQPGRLVSKHELLEQVWPGVYVTDAVLKTAVRELRRALKDDSHHPRYIETAHRRGYRFIAPTVAAEPAAPFAIATPTLSTAPAALAPPPVRYARSGRVHIAYQVVGSGERDIVFVMGWVSHLEYFWKEPSFARFLSHLAKRARLILFDKRGTGLSDAVPIAELPTLEQRLDDVRAVMEAAGSKRAVLMGVSEGGPLCSLFAATYPQRTEALVMIGSYARRLRDDDYPWGPTADERDRFCQKILDEWGGPVGLDVRAPSRADDPAFRDWWAAYLRMGASPGAAVALTRMNADIDVREVLPSIRVPTLVLHRAGDICLRVEEGRYLASRIPGAAFVELPGRDHLPFVGDQDSVLAAIDAFLASRHESPEHDRVLASVLTVQIPDGGRLPIDSAALLDRGRVLVSRPDQVVATFDGPGRAVAGALRLLRALAEQGVPASAGVDVGECVPTAADGEVFATAARLAADAPRGEIHVSQTVIDLVPGSGLLFMPMPSRPGVWRLVNDLA